MLIYETLKKDHQHLLGLINQLNTFEEHDDRRKSLIKEIRDEMVPHSRAEEAVFYNPLRTATAAQHVVRHSFQDHIEAESLLKALQAEDMVHMDWKKTAQKLKAALEHHIYEEENIVFELAKQVFTDEQATRISDAFEKMKPQIREEGFMGTALDLIENLMPPRFTKAVLGKKPNDIHP